MAGFKHGETRAKQLRAQSVRKTRAWMTAKAEEHLGRDLTPDELRDVAEQAQQMCGSGPMYGGD